MTNKAVQRKRSSPPTKEEKILRVIKEIQLMKEVIAKAASSMKSNLDLVLSMELNGHQPRS